MNITKDLHLASLGKRLQVLSSMKSTKGVDAENKALPLIPPFSGNLILRYFVLKKSEYKQSVMPMCNKIGTTLNLEKMRLLPMRCMHFDCNASPV